MYFIALALGIFTLSAAGSAVPLNSFLFGSILGDMVEQVTGDIVSVTTIVGPDSDAHTYKPNVSDSRSVTEADVIFVNGIGFEIWFEPLIQASGTKAKVYIATESIVPLKIDGETDPHAWNALPNGIIYIRNITQAMTKADPMNAEINKGNALRYISKLKDLHDRTTADLITLPN